LILEKQDILLCLHAHTSGRWKWELAIHPVG
jgi:hypothetical protein